MQRVQLQGPVRPAAALFALAIALQIVSACTSRTLPLPPPEVSSVSAPDSDGFVTVKGFALEGTSVGVLNERTLDGVIAAVSGEDCASTCRWEARLAALAGDSLRVWQFKGTASTKIVEVPEPEE